MASLLRGRGSSKHSRGSTYGGSGGGLGGCMPLEPQSKEDIKEKPSWQLRRKRRPVSVQLGLKERGIAPLNVMTPHSLVIHDNGAQEQVAKKSPDVPITKGNGGSPMDKDLPELPSISRPDSALGCKPLVFKRTTILPTTQNLSTAEVSRDAVELQGSLLPPRRGSDPAEQIPISPLSLRSTELSSAYSRSSRAPSPDTSATTTDGEMDKLRNLTSAPQRLSRSENASASVFSRTKKPFKAMTADELMECLPELNRSVLAHSWLPAMQEELQRIRTQLQEAAESRLQSQVDLETFGKDINSLALTARDMSRNYFDVLQKAGPLIDRDAKAVCEQLEATEAELRVALAKVEDNRITLSDREDLIQKLRDTVAANCEMFGGFIKDHAGNLLYQLQDIRTQEIRSLIDDQRRHMLESGESSQSSFIWIPEQKYCSYVERLRNVEQQVEEYSQVAKSQLEVIRSQSSDLDNRLEEYVKCMTVLDQRQARILELEKNLDAREQDLQSVREVARKHCETHDVLQSRYDRLEQRFIDLEETYKASQSAEQQQLAGKIAENVRLRQQMSSVGLVPVPLSAIEASTETEDLETMSPTSPHVNTPPKARKPHMTAERHDNLSLRARRTLRGRDLPPSKSMLSLETGEAALPIDQLGNCSRTDVSSRRTGAHSGDSALPAREQTDGTGRIQSDGTRPKDSGSESSEQSSRVMLGGLRFNPPNSTIPITASQPTAIRRQGDAQILGERTPQTAFRTVSESAAGVTQHSTNPSNMKGDTSYTSAESLRHEQALPNSPPHPSENAKQSSSGQCNPDEIPHQRTNTAAAPASLSYDLSVKKIDRGHFENKAQERTITMTSRSTSAPSVNDGVLNDKDKAKEGASTTTKSKLLIPTPALPIATEQSATSDDQGASARKHVTAFDNAVMRNLDQHQPHSTFCGFPGRGPTAVPSANNNKATKPGNIQESANSIAGDRARASSPPQQQQPQQSTMSPASASSSAPTFGSPAVASPSASIQANQQRFYGR